jgi:putative transposase
MMLCLRTVIPHADKDFLSIDSNLYSLDAYDGDKFVTFSLKELYSLKFGMELKRSKIQSFASKHGRKGEIADEKVLPP